MKIRRIVLALAAIGIAIAAVIWDAVTRWRAASNALVNRLREARRRPSATRYDAADLSGIPAPVTRYFEKVLHDGHPIITSARLTQHGLFLMNPDTKSWKPFGAVEDFTATPPGFVWDARIEILPGIQVYVRDSVVDGRGAMLASAAGVLKLVDVHDTPDLTEAALQRYLAEAVWFPTALLPSQGVVWTAVDDSTARASITAAGTTVSLDFKFGTDGLVKDVYTPARYRSEGGKLVSRPWSATFSRYEERRRVLIPIQGEVAWELPEGRLPYWRGTIVRADYDYAE